FPTGMRLVNAIDQRPTPWFWAINGAAGVLAASIAVAVSITFSISTCIWIGAACYLTLAAPAVALMRASFSARPAIGPEKTACCSRHTFTGGQYCVGLGFAHPA